MDSFMNLSINYPCTLYKGEHVSNTTTLALDRQGTTMVSRPAVAAVICVGLFLIIQSLIPKAMALRRSTIDQYMMEDQRTHKRKNYMMQRTKNNNMASSLDNVGITYETEPYDPDRNPEELSAFIVDYANMIRNDVILLDKSVETRTRKRGNIKVKKYNNQVISDPPCKCKYQEATQYLGKKIIPETVQTRVCGRGEPSCEPPYACREIYYDLPILRARVDNTSTPSLDLPADLRFRWYTDTVLISVGCFCARDYVMQN